ncbi:MAG TPA: FHA domain-containing protein, partial [Anaerolineales bacterium]|nr:FHA domain-containing protein [Anaerolineales bacterium]
MPAQDQLEIIDPQGRIRFYPLDPTKGLTNIGRHLDNDLILNRPGVAAFHAMLDHRSKPYTLVVLARNEKTLLDGEPAPINVPTELKSWAAIEIGGHQLIYLASEDAQTAEQLSASVAAATDISSSTNPPPEVPLVPSFPLSPTSPTPPDPALSVEPSARALAVDPGQTVTLDLTLANGGYKPLTFAVALDGLDPAWMTVTPPQLEVPARQRAVVSIAIAPSRQSATRAGTYTATITVTTPSIPEWKNQTRLPVTVNPYAEFSISEIAPRAQTLYPNAAFVQAKLEVTNRGNADAAFRLTGEDERYTCRFEFKLPADSLSQPRQAELRLAPGESASVEVRVTPIARLRAGLSPRRHFFTVTVAPSGGLAAPRAVLGEVREPPLFGALAFALTAILLVSLAVFIFRPNIAAFTAAPTHIQVGQDVTLTWSAAPLASLRISPDIGPVPGPDGRMTISPTKDTVYTLVAENFLSWINPDWFRATREVAVLVDPVLPGILFTTDRDSITAGETVTLTWQVSDAEHLILVANGIPESILPGQFTGSRSIQLNEDTEFVLQARNEFTTAEGVSAILTIRVTPAEATPAPTAPPQPIIDRFEISPTEITAGGQVTIYWSVSGVDRVFIEPLPGEFPPSGNMV